MTVFSANRFLFGMLLLVLFALTISTPFGEAGQFLATLMAIAFLGIIFPDTVQGFLQDSRFKTLPRLSTAIALTVLDLTVTFGLVFFWLILIALYFPAYLTKLESLSLDITPGTIAQLWTFITGAIFVPFYEEFAFRGVALRAYERARSPIYAAILTAFIFALVHGTLIQLLTFIPGSFLAARAVQNRGSWWLAVIPHVVNNGLIFGLFPFLPAAAEEEDPQLIVGIIALAIALFAFAIASHWLKAFQNKKIEIDFKKYEKIWTPTLISLILFGISLILITTFAPVNTEDIATVNSFLIVN